MKVLAITNVPVPYRVEFFNELAKYVELTVIYEQSIEQQKHRDKKWFTEKPLNFKSISIAKANNRISYNVLFKELRRAKDDIIFMMGYSNPSARAAIFWLRLHKVPYILTCDGAFIKDENLGKREIKKFLIRKANLYFSTGNPSDEFFVFYGAEKNRIRRISFSSLHKDDIFTSPVTNEEKDRVKDTIGIREEKVILSVGQFIHRKGYDVLLKALRYVDSKIGVYIVGGTPPSEYTQIINEYKLNNVHFVGFKTKEELKKYYLAADLFVLPTREDIWGLVINEAMACGLPIITTNKCIAGLVLVNEGKNGHIVNVEDPKALAEAIEQIMNNAQLRKKMADNSLSIIQDYTIEKMAEEHYRHFQSFISEK